VCVCKRCELYFLSVHGVIFCVSRKVNFRITYLFGFSFGSSVFDDKFVQMTEYKSALNSGLLIQLTWADEQ